jgi:hypothetical protein
VKRGPTVETITTDAAGHGHVVEQCQECGGTDLLDRIHTDHEHERER